MMKRIMMSATAVTALLTAMTASAVAPGFYMGLMLGPATNGASDQQAQTVGAGTTLVTPRSKQFATRLYLGNQVGKYAGFELGLDHVTKIKYDTKNVQTCGSPNASVKAIDFLGKGILPVSSSFDVYGKVGVGYMYTTTAGSLNPDPTKACGKSQHEGFVRPIIGVGASYDITQNWVTDFALTRLMVGGTIKTVDEATVGISYHFVDTYCGQFLC